jgi:tetratricopeptide (TPR) repeat protein
MRIIGETLQRNRFIAMACLLSFVCFLFAQEEIPQQVLDWRKAAEQFQKSGNLVEAQSEYEKIIRSYPNTVYALDSQANLIILHLQASQPEQAQSALEVLWRDYASLPEFVKRAHEIGWDFVKAADYQTALQIYTDLQTQFPDHERAVWFQRSVVQTYLEQGDMENVKKAIGQMKTNYSDHPDYIPQVHQTAVRLRDKKLFAMAGEIYESLLSRYPDCPDAALLKRMQIQNCLDLGQLKTAVQETDVFFSDFSGKPDFVRQAHELGWEFVIRKDYDTALGIYTALLEQFPDHERAAWFQRSVIQVYLEQGDQANLAQAVEEMKTNFQNHPDYVKQMEAVADRFMAKEQYDLANGIFEILQEQYPEHVRELWLLQKQIRSDLGRGDEAAADARLALIQRNFAGDTEYPDALSWTAYEYRKSGRYVKAIQLYQDLYAMNPESKVRLRCDEGIARAYVRLGDDAKVQEQVDRIYADYYTDNPSGVAFYVLAIGEEYYNHAQAAAGRGDEDSARAAYVKSINLLEEAIPTLPEDRYRCMASYMIGLDYWYLEEWLPAAEAFLDAIQANPRFEFAGSMHRLVSGCYENLKLEGQIDNEEADPIIEWGYQTVFDRYPQNPAFEAEYAAVRLGEINLARGKPATACVYFNWFLDRADEEDGRIAMVQRILEGTEGCR